MVELVFGFIFYLLYSLVFWAVLVPIVFVVATPIIFCIVLFRRGGNFVGNVKNEYRQLWMFWKEWGIFLLP
jgi:hypothetical protein